MMEKMSDLLSVEQARQTILKSFIAVKTEIIPSINSLGRILAEPVIAPQDFPTFANSSMDGFAVISSDLQCATLSQPVQLEIIEEIPAGVVPQKIVRPGQAARIMTGAMVPQGADCVIPVELTLELDGGSQVLCNEFVQPGQFVRPIGLDFHQGNQLIPAGTQMKPHHLGLLASVNVTHIQVFCKPKIALLATGNELISAGTSQSPGKIIDSNSIMLASFLEQAGAIVVHLGIALDTLEDVQSKLEDGVNADVDLIISSAGVSVGKFDFVRTVIAQQGKIDFWRVNIRPGKPLAFGNFQGIPYIGLPGNPVSSFVTCLLFVLPVIKTLMGFGNPLETRLSARLLSPLESDGRESYLRGIASLSSSGEIQVHLIDSHQGSGNLSGLVGSNALLIVPSGVKSLPFGAQVKIILIDELRNESSEIF
jgi:molybdopterin molybdotransferase